MASLLEGKVMSACRALWQLALIFGPHALWLAADFNSLRAEDRDHQPAHRSLSCVRCSLVSSSFSLSSSILSQLVA